MSFLFYTMFPSIKSIKKKRLMSELTQKDLAKISLVSQSMIAKIESGKIEPSYSIVQKLFTTIENYSSNDLEKCSDIMSKKMYFISKNKKVKDATKLMHKHSISQIPVTEKNTFVGLITESTILDKLTSGIDYSELSNLEIKEIMENPLPTVNKDFYVKNIIPIVKESGSIIIMDKEKPVGIISKSDLI